MAQWLVEKGRPDEAVALLSAWAAKGANDSEGQQLLADALRIDPSSRVAQMAFERMEGMSGDHADLDAAALQARKSADASEGRRAMLEKRTPLFRGE